MHHGAGDGIGQGWSAGPFDLFFIGDDKEEEELEDEGP